MKILLSDITCGHSCWFAKEDECKCSCGGKNHGVLLVEGAEQPQRMKRSGGKVYFLEAVGSQIELMNRLNEILPVYDGRKNANAGWFDLNPAKAGNPFLIQYATQVQAKKWKELSKYKDVPEDDWYFVAPAMLWRREDVSNEYF